MASPSTVISLGYGSWGTVNDVITLGYGIEEVAVVSITGLNYFVVLPGTITPVQLPAMSETSYALLSERVTSNGSLRFVSSGETRMIADSSLSGLYYQLAAVELPATVTPVQVE